VSFHDSELLQFRTKSTKIGHEILTENSETLGNSHLEFLGLQIPGVPALKLV